MRGGLNTAFCVTYTMIFHIKDMQRLDRLCVLGVKHRFAYALMELELIEKPKLFDVLLLAKESFIPISKKLVDLLTAWGPIGIAFGEYLSTRTDCFPAKFCTNLKVLHTSKAERIPATVEAFAKRKKIKGKLTHIDSTLWHDVYKAEKMQIAVAKFSDKTLLHTEKEFFIQIAHVIDVHYHTAARVSIQMIVKDFFEQAEFFAKNPIELCVENKAKHIVDMLVNRHTVVQYGKHSIVYYKHVGEQIAHHLYDILVAHASGERGLFERTFLDHMHTFAHTPHARLKIKETLPLVKTNYLREFLTVSQKKQLYVPHYYSHVASLIDQLPKDTLTAHVLFHAKKMSKPVSHTAHTSMQVDHVHQMLQEIELIGQRVVFSIILGACVLAGTLFFLSAKHSIMILAGLFFVVLAALAGFLLLVNVIHKKL